MKIKPTMIHPDLRPRASVIKLVMPTYTERKFRLAHAMMQALKGKIRSKKIRYQQVHIPRGDGSLLRLCVYSPLTPQTQVPGLVWLHGGGYAMGIPEQDEIFIERFILASGCTVVSPDYRLSIQAPYPAALDDAYLALQWLKLNSSFYGVRTDQLMVGGDSAGGGLTIALCLLARDRGEIAIAYQMPLYPMIDDVMQYPSAQVQNALVWSSGSNRNAWKLYLGKLHGAASIPYYAAPMRCHDWTKLPPAMTFVGDIELFHDETLEFVNRLQQAHVPVTLKVFEGCFHGFDIVGFRTPIADAAVDFLMSNFTYAVDHYFAAQPTL